MVSLPSRCGPPPLLLNLVDRTDEINKLLDAYNVLDHDQRLGQRRVRTRELGDARLRWSAARSMIERDRSVRSSEPAKQPPFAAPDIPVHGAKTSAPAFIGVRVAT